MRQPQQVDDETMYTAWVMAGRNGNVAAKQLGIKPANLRHHVRTKNFETRYQAEMELAGNAIRRLEIAKRMSRLPLIYDRLEEIALGKVTQIIGVSKDGEPVYGPPQFRDQIGAAQTILRSLPSLPNDQGPRPITALTLVDARSMSHPGPTITELPESIANGDSLDYDQYDELPAPPNESSMLHVTPNEDTDAASYVADQIAQRMSQ